MNHASDERPQRDECGRLRRAICGVFSRPTRRYIVAWRHRVLDTADYPFRGSGFACGKSASAALNEFFCPAFPPMGDTSHLAEKSAAWRRGDIEITRMELA